MFVYKDENYIICKKAPGFHSQISPDGKDMISLISDELKLSPESIYPIHRLDALVGGTMIYALNKPSAAKLSQMIADRRIGKQYLAVIHNKPESEKGVFKDYLFKDSSKNKSFVVKRLRKGVKEASLEYEILDAVQTDEGCASLVKITLHTGRTHQIRVQFSHREMPLFGDRRYGSGKDGCPVALWSHTISFLSPFDNSEKMYTTLPDTQSYPWNLFNWDEIQV